MINFLVVFLLTILFPSSAEVLEIEVDKAEAEYVYNLSKVDSLNQQLEPSVGGRSIVFELKPTPLLSSVLEQGKELYDKNSIDYTHYVGDVNRVKSNLQELKEFIEGNETNKYVIFTEVNQTAYEKFKSGEISINQLKLFSGKTVVKDSETMLFTDKEVFVPIPVSISNDDHLKFLDLVKRTENSLNRVADIRDLNVEVAELSSLSEAELDSIKESLPREIYVFEKMKRITSDMPSLAEYKNGQIGSEMLCELNFAPDYRVYCPMAKALELLNEDYKRDLGSDLKITSAYRDYNYQAMLYANDGGTGFVARPGYSLHGAGCAIDVASLNGGFIDWDEEGKVWLDENGYKYGLMQKEWQSRTSSVPEPWHYEFFTTVKETGPLSLITRAPILDVEVDLPKSP